MTIETMSNSAAAEPSLNDKIVCHIDGALVHSVVGHIKSNHAETWTVERYQREFPGEPLLSEYAKMVIARKREEDARKKAEVEAKVATQAATVGETPGGARMLTASLAVFHEIFDLGTVPAALSSRGTPIQISVMSGHDAAAYDYLPDVDRNYVFNIDLLKKVIVGFQLNKPVYLWGFHGTGKTTILEQACARTKRPFVRVQHTQNMQETDVLGQWTVKDGATIFQLGPLPMAMINGWTYCADEYDVAMPAVTALYQPVLEGKSLLIKEAPAHLRKIIPHPEFRFCATGNTNGIGDETGLYQGTLVQNAANYSRFGITEEVEYMETDIEISILQARVSGLTKKDAGKIVKFANEIRRMFRDGKISMTISPRELINACELAVAFGANYPLGMQLSFSNRLSRVDKKTVEEYMQRVFGA